MGEYILSRRETRLLDSLVKAYDANRQPINLFRDQLVLALTSSSRLTSVIHSVRSRLKDPDHLREKLIRKMRKCKSEAVEFDVTPENLLMNVNDLVGVRILHLHTRQIASIDGILKGLFEESKYTLIEGPFARTWDDESRRFFGECQIATQESPSMYTSVHYVVGSASRTTITAEIQLRTLMEEVWGEVDHTINYPAEIPNLACREQLKVLARVTSSASRLVDSIFATLEDYKNEKATQPQRRGGVGRRR